MSIFFRWLLLIFLYLCVLIFGPVVGKIYRTNEYLIAYHCNGEIRSIFISSENINQKNLLNLQDDLLCDDVSGSAQIFSVSRVD